MLKTFTQNYFVVSTDISGEIFLTFCTVLFFLFFFFQKKHAQFHNRMWCWMLMLKKMFKNVFCGNLGTGFLGPIQMYQPIHTQFYSSTVNFITKSHPWSETVQFHWELNFSKLFYVLHDVMLKMKEILENVDQQRYSTKVKYESALVIDLRLNFLTWISVIRENLDDVTKQYNRIQYKTV